MILSKSEKRTPISSARNTIFADTDQIKYNTNGIKTGSSKKKKLAQSQEKAQLNPVDQQDSVTLLLTPSKSLLQMRETEEYCNQTWEIKSDINKLYSVVDCSKFLVRALHMSHGGIQCQI